MKKTKTIFVYLLFCCIMCSSRILYAQQGGSDEIAKEVKDAKMRKKWFKAIDHGDKEVVALLIKKRFKVDTIDIVSDTGLIVASRMRNEEMVRMLIDAGANVNAKNETTGWSPIMHAASNGEIKIAQMLIDAGASVNSLTTSGQSPCYIGARHQSASMVELLLSRGAKCNLTDTHGTDAISIAARNGSVEVIRFLMKHGFSLGNKNHSKEDLLFSAVYLGRLSVAKLLIENGADVNGTKKDGKTFLEYFVNLGSVEKVEFLLENGAKVTESILSSANSLTMQKLLSSKVVV